MSTTCTVRSLFTEYEDHLTAGMPDLVAVGYVNARRRDGLGERKARLVVQDNTVIAVPVVAAEQFGGGFGNLFDISGFGGRR